MRRPQRTFHHGEGPSASHLSTFHRCTLNTEARRVWRQRERNETGAQEAVWIAWLKPWSCSARLFLVT